MNVKTVGELIEALKKVSPEMKVGTWDAYFDRLEEGAHVSLLHGDLGEETIAFIGTTDFGGIE